MTTDHPDPLPPTDAALLARLRAGEDAAFDELVQLAAGRMLAAARRILSSEDDAQDAVQEAFLNAFKALPKFDGRSLLTTWLHRITINVSLMKLRTQRRRHERPIGDMLPEFLPDGHAKKSADTWNPTASGGIEQAEMMALVRAKIDLLPEQFRTILVLRDVEGLDTDETATVLGLTSAAVKTRLHRARQALRELLNPYMTADQASGGAT